MSEDQFERRGNALEDMFFYRSDQELLEQIKQDLADKEAREQLASFSGITNEHLLDELTQVAIATGDLSPRLAVLGQLLSRRCSRFRSAG